MDWIREWFSRQPSTQRFFGNSSEPLDHWLRPLPEVPGERFFGSSTPSNHTLFEAIFKWIEEELVKFYLYIRPTLPELITLALCGCALCLIVTGDNSKWYGRIVMISLVGASILVMF